MFTSLLQEVRIWPVLWRRRLHYYWLLGDKGNLVFVAMLGLPVVVLAAIVHFAYSDRLRVPPAQIEAVRRNAAERSGGTDHFRLVTSSVNEREDEVSQLSASF